jgi:hypothetical protein
MPELIFYLLPALLVFAITFGALETSKIFAIEREGKKIPNRRLDALIGLIVAGFSLTSEQVIGYVWQAMPWAAILFIIIFFFGFVKSIFKVEKGEKPNYILIAIIAMLGLLLIYSQPQLLTWLPSLGLASGDLTIIIGLIIIAIIFYAASTMRAK